MISLMPSLNTLPVELLAYLFGLLMSSVPIALYDEQLLRLNLVARQINKVIENTPSLWAVINTACNSRQHITKAISKSRGEPLMVILGPKLMAQANESYLDPFMPLLLPHCDRWACLRIQTWHRSLHTVRASRLKYLHLETAEPRLLDGYFPELTDLTSYSGWPLGPSASSSPMRLRRLEVSDYYSINGEIPSRLLKLVLQSNPELEVLRFEGCSSWTPLRNDSRTTGLSLPCLRTCIIDTCQNEFSIKLAEEVLQLGSAGVAEPFRLQRLRCLELDGWKSNELKLEELVMVLQSNSGLEKFKFSGSITNRGTRSASNIDALTLPHLHSFMVTVEEDWMLIALAKSVQAKQCKCVMLSFLSGRLGHCPLRDKVESETPLRFRLPFITPPIRYEAADLSETPLHSLIRRLRPRPINLMVRGIDLEIAIEAGDQRVQLKVLTAVPNNLVEWLSSNFPESPLHMHYTLDKNDDISYPLTQTRILRGVKRFTIDSFAMWLWSTELQSWPLPDLTHLIVHHDYNDEINLIDLAAMLEWRGESNGMVHGSSRRLRRLEILGRCPLSTKTVKLLQRAIDREAILILPDGITLTGGTEEA